MNQLPIATPPWTTLGRRLESMCRKAMYEFDLLEGETKILIALSGGKDSLTLLYLLKALSGKGFPPFEIFAAHVAGDYSCGASLGTNFIKPICEALNVPLTICESAQKLATLECYGCSRERRSLLFDTAKKLGCKIVAFGHHREDNIETLLMNLLHKGEFAGNLPKVPMHNYDVTIIRPLIFISEQEIVEFAKKYHFARISCQCPVGQTSVRKTVKEIIKELEEHFPHVRSNLAHAAKVYGSDKATRC
ncbi:MAG: tRNA 2-thiocytidine biosynthesis TtcA family protein [Candidatus Rhabdochlamydia sp.]